MLQIHLAPGLGSLNLDESGCSRQTTELTKASVKHDIVQGSLTGSLRLPLDMVCRVFRARNHPVLMSKASPAKKVSDSIF